MNEIIFFFYIRQELASSMLGKNNVVTDLLETLMVNHSFLVIYVKKRYFMSLII